MTPSVHVLALPLVMSYFVESKDIYKGGHFHYFLVIFDSFHYKALFKWSGLWKE
jgi:hypothetical protein